MSFKLEDNSQVIEQLRTAFLSFVILGFNGNLKFDKPSNHFIRKCAHDEVLCLAIFEDEESQFPENIVFYFIIRTGTIASPFLVYIDPGPGAGDSVHFQVLELNKGFGFLLNYLHTRQKQSQQAVPQGSVA